MAYNLDNLWRMAEGGPIPTSTAILALAMELRVLRRVLQSEPFRRTQDDENPPEEPKIGGSK